MINDSLVDVYTWWDSFNTAPVTGSLLSVAAGRRLAGFGDLCILDSSARAIRWEPCASEMATGSGRLLLNRSGFEFQVNIDVPWNASVAFVNLHSDGIYELDTLCLPDVLGLTERDSRSVRPLVPDVNVVDMGFHDVTVVDMDHVVGPDFPVADLDILRGMGPLPGSLCSSCMTCTPDRPGSSLL